MVQLQHALKWGIGERIRAGEKGFFAFLLPPAKADRLNFFTQNQEDRLSAALECGFGLKRLTCTVNNNDTSEKDKNLCNAIRSLLPHPPLVVTALNSKATNKQMRTT